jgi:hypothetical protein
VDADNAPEITLADDAAPSDGHLAAPLRVRWRRRAVGRRRAAPGGAVQMPHSASALPHASRPASAPAADRAIVEPAEPSAAGDVVDGFARHDTGPREDGRHAGHGSQGGDVRRASSAGGPGNASEIGKPDDVVDTRCTGTARATRGNDESTRTWNAVDDDGAGRHAVDSAKHESVPDANDAALAWSADTDSWNIVDDDGRGRHADGPAEPHPAPEAHDAALARSAETGSWNIVDDDRPGRHADDPAEPRSAPEARDAAIAPGADAQLAPRDIELWLLARRTQGAALRLDFELRTALARQVFRRDFVYVSRQLHALEASRRVQGLDRARLDDALATLRQRADAIQSFMAQRATDLQAAIDARGPASARIAFARPARFQATIVSPGAHRFLTLLLRADETLARLEMAWLLGLVEPASRSALVSDCRRALLGFKDLACDLRRAVGLLVQEVNSQRRAGDTTRDGR